MLWGWSPAFDLLSELEDRSSDELNILIVGASDGRHVLKTMAKTYNHGDLKINFYILDMLVELIARQLLLFTVALEPPDILGISEKSRLWMELYGNTLLRATSAEYLLHKSYQLLQIVTNNEYLKKRMPCINLERIKYKEKDQLENIFKYWIENDFNIIKNWDGRLRKSLATRYDAKMGVFDWDYFMKLKDKTEIINSIEYKQWRNTGVAFTWLETEYCITNPTFALGIFAQGDQMLSHGYCGDMEFGPYFTFGTQCEDEEMMKKRNGTYKKRATDITERNLSRIFHEIETKSSIEFAEGDRDMGGLITAVPNLDMESDPKLKIEVNKTKEDYKPIETKHQIIFLPLNALDVYPDKEEFKRFFNLMFFGQGVVNKINKGVLSMLKTNGPLIMETRANCFTLSKDSMNEFEQSVKEMMKNLNLEATDKCDFSNQSVVKFKLKL